MASHLCYFISVVPARPLRFIHFLQTLRQFLGGLVHCLETKDRCRIFLMKQQHSTKNHSQIVSKGKITLFS